MFRRVSVNFGDIDGNEGSLPALPINAAIGDCRVVMQRRRIAENYPK